MRKNKFLHQIGQLVPAANAISWPVNEDYQKAQEQTTKKIRFSGPDEDGLYHKKGKIWIPSDATDLKLRILIPSHCGVMGHRGVEATCSIIMENFKWRNLAADVKVFVNSYLHCVISRTGERIPRPMANKMNGRKPNEVVHMDFLYMDPNASETLKYLLLLRDDLSSYVSGHINLKLVKWPPMSLRLGPLHSVS